MARILLSALTAGHDGGRTYLRNLVATFPKDRGDRLSILSHRRVDGLAERPDVEWISAPRWAAHPIARFLLGWIYFRFLWPRRHDFDVVCFAGGSFDSALPGDVATVVVFHNLLPFDPVARRRYSLGWRRLRHALLWLVHGWAMRRADLVIFISEHGRRVIDRILPRRRGSSMVITHMLSREVAPLDPDIAARLPERFVLYVSRIDAYKAQAELIQAWARLRQSRPTPEKLILVGPEYPPYARHVRETIRRCGVEAEVILFGEVPPEAVLDLASRSALNLFLSTCENCPFTLLELMSVGRPLLVSSWGVMPELGGLGLEYVDPDDVPAVAQAIERLLDDPNLRHRVAVAAERRSRLFQSDKAGISTWQAIREVAGGRTVRRPAPRPGVLPSSAR